jgi:sugar lactone lactonase YvrE
VGTGAGAGFATPLVVGADAAGNLFVVDAFGHTIRKVTPAGVVTTFAGEFGGEGIADGTGDAARFTHPHGICIDGATIYVADKANNVIRKIDASNTVTTFAGSGQAGGTDGSGALARFNGPFACVADGAGKLYVSDANNHTVRTIDLASGAVTTLAGTAGQKGSTDATGAAARFNTSAGIAYGGGKLYVADLNNQTIRVVDVASRAVTTLAGTAGAKGSTDATGAAARFNLPNGLALVGGTLYVADQANSTVRRVDVASGAVTTLAGAATMRGATDGNGAAARFFNPHALVADGAGNLFVADTLNHTVRKIVLATGDVTTLLGTAGVASTKLGPPPGVLNTPSGLALGAGGALFVATAHENAVIVFR